MEHLPTWLALVALIPAIAFYEQRQFRARPWLSWVSLACALALAIAAIVYFPAAVLKAVTILLLFLVWSAGVVLFLAAVERIPSAIGGRRDRGASRERHEERPRRPVPARASSAAR